LENNTVTQVPDGRFAVIEEESSIEVELEPIEEEASDADVNSPNDTTNSADEKGVLCRHLASSYLRKEGKFYHRSKPTAAMSASDMKRTAVHRIKRELPQIELTAELWRDVVKYAVEDVHDDATQSIPVWDGRIECRPDVPAGLIHDSGTASINSWSPPAYRSQENVTPDMSMLEDLLARVFVQASDRALFLDWLAYSLQNEAQKPAWSVLLFSRTKGTGKSTLCRLMRLLFGEENSHSLNGIEKLTGRFNKTIMTRKFITCEEVKLKPGTNQGNAIKTLISEQDVAVEAKGKEIEAIKQVCVFAMTTNHFPHWIESDDRRFLVIDCDHPGHASGPDREDFQSFMKQFHKWMEVPQYIASVWSALMQRKPSNSFNPNSLNIAAIDTPIMQQLQAESGEVLQQALAELLKERGIFAASLNDLRKIFTEDLKTNPNRIPHFMNDMRWRSVRSKWGGVDCARAIWVHPDYQVANGRVTGPDGYDQPVDRAEELEIIE